MDIIQKEQLIPDYGQMDVRVLRDRNNEIESDLIPKYSRNINRFEENEIIGFITCMIKNNECEII